ncbi:MAG: response regulator [Myxococcales bacterium]|nr:response regulator [Myxococcales bacterium]
MNWLPAGVLGALTANVLLVWVYVLLLRTEAPDERRYLRWWLGAWIASVVRYSAALALSVGGPPTLAGVEMLATLVNGGLVLVGALVFVGTRPSRLHAVPFGLAGALAVGAMALDAPTLWQRVPVFGVAGGAMIAAGILLWRRGDAGLFGRLTGGVFVAWGAHRLDYPFLRPVEWFAPYGFAFASVFEQVAAVSTLLLHLDRTRRSVRASEARYRGLVDEAPIGIFRVDLEMAIVDANPAFLEQVGVASVAELDEYELASFVPSADDRLSLAQTFRAGGSAAQPITLRRPDGRERRLMIQGRELRDPTGHPIGYEGVSRDVTDALRLEERLRATERLEAIGRLAGGVAHDFNNVLTVIQAGTRAAIDHPSPTKQRRLLDEVLGAAERGAALTRQLLTLSRARGTPERVELADEVRASLPFLRRLVGESCAIAVEAPSPVWVLAERAHVQQIVLNLVANARDAMPAGGTIHVAIRAEARDRGAAGRAVLEVRDEGVGMDAETRDKAFDAFFTTKPEAEGTGLGLPTVAAAAAHGDGTVHLESELGRGTVVTVRWPAVDAPALDAPTLDAPTLDAPTLDAPTLDAPTLDAPTLDAPTLDLPAMGAPAPNPASPGGSRPTRTAERPHGPAAEAVSRTPKHSSAARLPRSFHILVAEDEAAVRRALVRVLEAAGHRVVAAEDGEDALARFEELERIDLLVSDVRMPRCDGPALAVALRERQPDLPVLFVTGYAEIGPVEIQRMIPGAQVLAKPFLPHELTSAIAQVLGASSSSSSSS